jgi:hypothetical protein
MDVAGHRASIGDIKPFVKAFEKHLAEESNFMHRLLALIPTCGLTILQISIAPAQTPVAVSQSELKSVSASGDLPGLPPPPRGKSTILGGQIRAVDPVRDELTLKAFGERPLKILFDERTQVYLDGSKVRLRDLHPAEHASVQTLLDGTDVYALSIHVLSQSPVGEYQGRVVRYDSGSNELTISSVLLHDTITLDIPPGTPIARIGQSAFTSAGLGTSDLVPGALISVKFEPGDRGHGVVNQVSVLARPGSAFVFVGNVTFLDMHSGVLQLVDPADNNTYQISFDTASLPSMRTLRPGNHVMVTATFDGAHYMANAITIGN